MKKLYSYLAVGLAFFSAGLIAMYKIMGEQVKITVKRLKLKDSPGGTIQVHTDILGESGARVRLSRKERKKARKVKREDREQAKIIRHNEKKADKAIDRLEY